MQIAREHSRPNIGGKCQLLSGERSSIEIRHGMQVPLQSWRHSGWAMAPSRHGVMTSRTTKPLSPPPDQPLSYLAAVASFMSDRESAVRLFLCGCLLMACFLCLFV